MNDNFKIGLAGFINITSNNKNIFSSYNEIKPAALEIITRCLSQTDLSKSLDKIKVSGDFGEFDREITFVEYNPLENSMKFRAFFYESDFDGTITKMELLCTALSKVFSSKDNISLTKDGQTRIQIDWKIFVTN